MSARQPSALARFWRPRGWLWAALGVVWALSPACRKPGEGKLREGNAAAQAGKLEEARRAFSEAALALPGDPRPRVLEGNAQFALGRLAEAQASWNAALERDPSNAEAHLGLARVALEGQDAGVALQHLSSVGAGLESSLGVEVETVRARALLTRGAKGDAELALSAAEAALALRADFPQALHLKGSALLVLGRYSDAQAAFEHLQATHPKSPLGPYGLARLAAAQGRATDVLLHLQAAKTAAGPAWKAERVAADPAFVFLSTSEGFLALVGK
ncbi:MAG: tetratricopeptide repeat protein [Myxococcota bacterium]